MGHKVQSPQTAIEDAQRANIRLAEQVSEKQLQDTVIRMAKLLGYETSCAREPRKIKEYGKLEARQTSAPAVLEAPRRVTPEGLVPMHDQSTSSPDKFTRQTPGQVEVHCASCGRALYVAPSRVKYFARLYCNRSCKAADKAPVELRFWAKVQQRPGACWEWTGHRDKRGYARLQQGGRDGEVLYAHRLSYEMHKGPIPEGLHIDHLCRNRACVNPDHLDPVTPRENVLRGMAPTIVLHRLNECKRGHSLIGENVYVAPDGERQCRSCRRIRREGQS